MTDVQALAARARAHGLNVVSVHEDGDEVHIGDVAFGGNGEAVLIPEPDKGIVHIVGISYTYSWADGPDHESYDLGTWAERDALGYLRHLANCADRYAAEVSAALDLDEQREADAHEEHMLAEAGRREVELDGCSCPAYIDHDRDPDCDIHAEDGAPCCPDPDCGGNPCTFPGYADNH